MQCGNENDPCAVRSLLGWYVNGPVRHKSGKQEAHCNRIQILKSTDDEVKAYIIGERMIKEQFTPQVVSRMFGFLKENTESHYREKKVSS